MSIERRTIAINIAVYYAQVVAFIIVSYGLILLLYGRTKLSFLEWALIILVAFTIGYIPYLFLFLRARKKEREVPGASDPHP